MSDKKQPLAQGLTFRCVARQKKGYWSIAVRNETAKLEVFFDLREISSSWVELAMSEKSKKNYGSYRVVIGHRKCL
jgi:hypothetical protein